MAELKDGPDLETRIRRMSHRMKGEGFRPTLLKLGGREAMALFDAVRDQIHGRFDIDLAKKTPREILQGAKYMGLLIDVVDDDSCLRLEGVWVDQLVGESLEP